MTEFTSPECDAVGCEQPTPWDMIAIRIGSESFCCPNCALGHLNGLETAPDKIVLHDPQMAVTDGNHDVMATVDSLDEATEIVDSIADHPGFRG
jgi:hypothetical protein